MAFPNWLFVKRASSRALPSAPAPDPEAPANESSKAVAKRKSVPQSHQTAGSNSGGSGTKKAKSDDEDGGHHGGDGIDIKRIKAEPEPSGSGAQSSAMEDIGDDSYAGEEGADDFGDGEDFEGFAQYGEGQDFDDSLAGASGSGAGADGKGTHFICKSFDSEMDTGFLDVSNKSHSIVWKYFLKNKLQARAKCVLCGQILENKGGSTTTLARHMRKKHPDITDIPSPTKGRGEYVKSETYHAETILEK